ncbi:MAG: diacylglycerol kinase family lipid kinase [Candidatus Mcinerneyibacterium aminivorans]|uniref:Diacylglycerol kinase family lipid kinase n=1 Tax=Candidatus Mcinerneyibacterium aminivorans TaxID=2703815 RepID=A0A5D0MAF3_9BACT|nr:MAG: diacylglycerol kinase family lipid kinase [Candidatus Mcinerneyibacterium aminivorans]
MKYKVKLIVNPNSGQRRLDDYLPKVLYILSKNGYMIDLAIIKNDADLKENTKNLKNYDYLLVSGGDGTVNSVINETVEQNIPLGIIPTGTTNVLSIELNLPTNPFEAAYYLVNKANPTPYDVGKFGNQYFGLMVSYGFDAHTISKVDSNLKQIIGRYAYALAGFSTLFTYKPEPIYVNLFDGKDPVKGFFVVVGNASFYGGNYSITPLAKMDDGLLDICIFKKKGVLKSISYIMDVLKGTHISSDDVEYYQVPKVRLITEEIPGQIDGDLAGLEKEHVDIEVCPQAITILT